MTSAQAMHNYAKLECEDDLSKPGDKALIAEAQKESKGEASSNRKVWPLHGQIEFDNVTMSYRKTLEPAIRNLSFTVQAGMKIGVVGRTGAGKSSIFQALFRLCELSEGSIKIDGIDTRKLGLHLLRQSIAYIPQQPFLIQGSVRENLDPF